MAYSVAADVKVVLLRVEDYSFTDEAIALFIAKADALIDGYLANYFPTIPFTTTPALIKSLSVDLACFYLLRTTLTNDRVEEGNNWVFDWYNKAISTLKKIASGELSLGSSFATTAKIASTDEDYVPMFDVDDVVNWKRSSLRLEDISNARD